MSLKKDLSKFYGEEGIVYSDDPMFWHKKAEYCCDPESICQTEYVFTWRILYFIGNVVLIENFIKFLLGKKSFMFGNEVYEAESHKIGHSFEEVFSNEEWLADYLSEIPEYHKKFVKLYNDQGLGTVYKTLSTRFLNLIPVELTVKDVV